MQTLYDVAGLAVVAYGEVLADGTSPDLNSGVTTAKTATGNYTITLPANKQQSSNRDLMFVTPKQHPLDSVPTSVKVDDDDASIKKVALCNASTFADSAFSFLILRTIVTPPSGSPG